MIIKEKIAFAHRLNELCDDNKVPPKGKARQTTLAKFFRVSQKGARKWLEGEGFPSTEKAIEIARWGGVYFDWLMTGRFPKKIPQQPISQKMEHATTLMQALPEEKQDQAIKIISVLAEQTTIKDRNGTEG